MQGELVVSVVMTIIICILGISSRNARSNKIFSFVVNRELLAFLPNAAEPTLIVQRFFCTVISCNWCDVKSLYYILIGQQTVLDSSGNLRPLTDSVLLFFPASMLRHNQESNDKPQTLRVGSLVVRSLGQLLPHQLQSFHTRDAVYPVSGSCLLPCVSSFLPFPF